MRLQERDFLPMPKPLCDPEHLRTQAGRLLERAGQQPDSEYAELFRRLAAELLEIAAEIEAASRAGRTDPD
jgi:hypothetical protein